jgi:acetyl-CoA carboxylase/biotin carboxylase 1
MRSCVQDLVRHYIEVEQHFQLGHYDKCVSQLREKHKDEGMATVVNKIFSHLSVNKKNQLIIKVNFILILFIVFLKQFSFLIS